MIIESIELTLNHGMYTVRTVPLATEVTTALADWKPHIGVFDMDLDGAPIMTMLADAYPQLPVIGLTRRVDLKTKLAAFEAGVDDVLTVPFAPKELLARTIAVLRRSYSEVVTFTPVIKQGDLEIDIFSRTVRVGGSEIHLPPIEQSLLYLLAASAGHVVTRDKILDTLWGADYVAESNIVDRQIRSLRVLLHDDWRQPHFIATVPGQGYRFLPSFTTDC